MKTIMTKNKNWMLAAVLGLTTLAHSYTYSNDVTLDLMHDGKVFTTDCLKVLKVLFDSKDKKTPFVSIVKHLENYLRDFNNKILQHKNAINTAQNPALAKKTLVFADYVLKRINSIFQILKRYVGKGAMQSAAALCLDLKAVFDKDSTFKEIETQLDLLLNQAKADKDFVAEKVIIELIGILAAEDIEWNKHNGITLLDGIATRMKSK